MAKKTEHKEKTIEERLLRLEEIGNALDRGMLPLEDQLRLFEEGVLLARECRAYIESVQLKITELSAEFPDQADAASEHE